jgi:hypothetical protein
LKEIFSSLQAIYATSSRVLPASSDKSFAGCAAQGSQSLAEPALVSADGKGILGVAVWEQNDSATIHLVNLTNPMMLKGPVHEILPISGQKIAFRVPARRRISRVSLLVAQRDVPFRMERDKIYFEVPSIELHEVIAMDFQA